MQRPLRIYASFIALIFSLQVLQAASQAVAPSPVEAPAPSLVPSIARYSLNVTVGWKSPDCFSRPVILTNGGLGNASIEVTQGQILEVTVYNNLPADYPQVLDGISVHWHGLDQRGSEWYDGIGYITQCPIPIGQNFTYRFQVNDQPGTYFWHGHTGMGKNDGFEGFLVVRPPGNDILKDVYNYDEEVFLSLTDWYHDIYSPLTYATSRPFDPSKATPESGNRVWVGSPQAILMNYKGNWQDCQISNTTVPPNCSVTVDKVPAGRNALQPGASAFSQGCEHFTLVVDPGKTYRLRLVSFSSLMMLSFAMEGHSLQIIAADATPTDPLVVDHVDINSGQRYDVIFTANATVPRTYYMEALPQYRNGTPAGFGFLKYTNQPNMSSLPTTPTPNAGAITPWSTAQADAVHTAAWLVDPQNDGVPSPELTDQLAGADNLAVPKNVTLQVKLNVTQPLLTTGQLHWAFNDITDYQQPSCMPLLQELYDQQQSFLTSNLVTAQSPAVDLSSKQFASDSDPFQVYVYGERDLDRTIPVTGKYIVELELGDVVEVVFQNLAGNASGGDYYTVKLAPADQAGRGGQEQHPIHLHGHHAWYIGSGLGIWNESSVSTYNLENPIFRDTFELPQNGWFAIRFIADNPGTWEMHCHYPVHFYMGQRLTFAEAIGNVSVPPPDLPKCPETCTASFAGWNQSFVAQKYGDSGFI